jgi:hypothetical protein
MSYLMGLPKIPEEKISIQLCENQNSYKIAKDPEAVKIDKANFIQEFLPKHIILEN